jgi:hypothetical protein
VLLACFSPIIVELRALTGAWLRVYSDERPRDCLGLVSPLTLLQEVTGGSVSYRTVKVDGEACASSHRNSGAARSSSQLGTVAGSTPICSDSCEARRALRAGSVTIP